ncbi:hypothetical protein L208DRAFT_1405738, partial [Tricholoma matsutake]
VVLREHRHMIVAPLLFMVVATSSLAPWSSVLDPFSPPSLLPLPQPASPHPSILTTLTNPNEHSNLYLCVYQGTPYLLAWISETEGNQSCICIIIFFCT